MGCRFFFAQAREFIDKKFPNLFGGTESDAKARLAAKGTIDGYGWLNSVYDVAKEGLFNLEGHNPVNSVLLTNLHEVLMYLSWKNACSQYEKKYTDLHSKIKS